jgi:hypothetical protein
VAPTRDVILDRLSDLDALQRFCDAPEYILRALEALFLAWRVPRDELPSLKVELLVLLHAGYIQLADTSRSRLAAGDRPEHEAYVISPLLIHIWCDSTSVRRHALLETAHAFLRWDDPITYSGESFERQLAALGGFYMQPTTSGDVNLLELIKRNVFAPLSAAFSQLCMECWDAIASRAAALSRSRPASCLCKISQDDTGITGADVARKIVLTLVIYPDLLAALSERRECTLCWPPSRPCRLPHASLYRSFGSH